MDEDNTSKSGFGHVRFNNTLGMIFLIIRSTIIQLSIYFYRYLNRYCFCRLRFEALSALPFEKQCNVQFVRGIIEKIVHDPD